MSQKFSISIFLCVLLFSSLASITNGNAQFTDFHESHTGEIVFCNEPVLPGKENKQNIKSTFSASEHIYGLAYFPKKFEELVEKNYVGFTVYVNGEEAPITFTQPGKDERFEFYQIYRMYRDNPTFPIEIKPSKDQATNEIEVEGWADFLLKLPQKKNTIRIVLEHPGGKLAEDTLILDMTDFDKQAFKKETAEIIKNLSASHAKDRKLPDVFNTRSQEFVDPDMSKEQLKFMMLLSDEFINCKEFKKVVIGEGRDWKTITEDDSNRPKYKVNGKPIRIVYKGRDDWCYYVKNVYFIRRYKGNGQYGDTEFIKATDHKRINCKSVR